MPRSKEVSAGLLVFRRTTAGIEVLLGHPGGPFWAKKDDGAWTIPKGLVEPDDDLISAARREFTEETSFVADGELFALSPVNQKSGKVVHAFACEKNFKLDTFASNTIRDRMAAKVRPPSELSRNRSYRLFLATGRNEENHCLPAAVPARA